MARCVGVGPAGGAPAGAAGRTAAAGGGVCDVVVGVAVRAAARAAARTAVVGIHVRGVRDAYTLANEQFHVHVPNPRRPLGRSTQEDIESVPGGKRGVGTLIPMCSKGTGVATKVTTANKKTASTTRKIQRRAVVKRYNNKFLGAPSSSSSSTSSTSPCPVTFEQLLQMSYNYVDSLNTAPPSQKKSCPDTQNL